MRKITKNTLLNYIEEYFDIEKNVNPIRIFDYNNKQIQKGDIIYLIERDIRPKDNFALQFALKKSEELNLKLRIIHPKINYEVESKEKFILIFILF